MAIRLKVQDTTGVTLKVGGTDTARLSAESGIPLYPDEYAGAYSVTPTEAEQTLQTEGLMMTDDVTVGAIDAEYVGSEVPRRTSLNVSGLTVTAPSGYYANALSETVVPVLEDVTKSYMPTETAQSETFTAGTGYDGIGEVSVTVNAIQTETKSATPSESAQSITPTSGKYLTEVSVGAISSTYVGSGIDRRDETDLSASGATVTVPAGYYAEQETKIIPNGAVVVETQAPKKEHGTYIIETTVDQSAGYIESNHVSEQTPLSLENKTATPSGVQQVITPTNKKCYLDSVTVDPIPSQYIVPSGTKQITANGTGIDVKAYEYADVAVPASAPTLQTKSKTYTPTTSQQTEAVTSDGGYDGLDTVNVTVNAMPSGSEGTPTATKGAVSGHAVSVTPSVTNSAGYIPGGTHTGTAVSVSASELVSGTYTVDSSGTKDVTNYASASVPAGTAGTPALTVGAVENHAKTIRASVINSTGWITGGTVSGASTSVSASDLVSGSETKTANGTYDVTNLAQLVVNVSGGGGASNWVLLGTKDCGTVSTSSTTAATINKDFSVSGVGDYDLLVVETSVNTKTNNRHAATARLILLTAGTTIGTKNGATIATATWNVKLSSTGTATSRASTTPRGIYPYSCTVSTTNGVTSAAIVMYSCYNSTQTGTINGTYTARVYGVKLYDLIGG